MSEYSAIIIMLVVITGMVCLSYAKLSIIMDLLKEERDATN